MKAVLEFADVAVKRGERFILHTINWSVSEAEHWVVLGPNGAGKTTLIQLASGLIFPTVGMISVLGEMLGLVDVFELKPRIGISSAALHDRLFPDERVVDVVRTAAFGMTATWREEYEEQDIRRADTLLTTWGLSGFADRKYASLSEGERKRVLIARALMSNPELLLLDEPAAGLDIAAREALTRQLAEFCSDPAAPVTIHVTHHVDEIPPGTTHVLLLREGQQIAAGPIAQTLNDENISQAFGLPLTVVERDTAAGRRWTAFPR